MKKILSIMLALSLCVNISFAFDPYADEEIEKKSYKKLYYGIVLTLLGGFLAYDGFSKEEVDVSKPSVDYTSVSHSEWVQNPAGGEFSYQMRSGVSLNNVSNYDYDDDTREVNYNKYEYDGEFYSVEPNKLYNNGNVDLKNITIEVRYRYGDGTYIGDNTGTHVVKEGYHVAETKSSQSTSTEHVVDAKYENITLAKGETITWQDIWDYTTVESDPPNGNQREPYFKNGELENLGIIGLNLGKDSHILMDVRVKLNKYKQYKPIYHKKNKCDAEGVAGTL